MTSMMTSGCPYGFVSLLPEFILFIGFPFCRFILPQQQTGKYFFAHKLQVDEHKNEK